LFVDIESLVKTKLYKLLHYMIIWSYKRPMRMTTVTTKFKRTVFGIK
jgi:hypothetical protein